MEDAPERTISVAILACPESGPLGIHGLFETLCAAGRLWPQLTGQPACDVRLEPKIIARTSEPFRTSIGIPVTPDHGLGDAPPAEIIVVADVELPFGADPTGRWVEEIEWLKRRAEGTALICSTCSGSLVLAEAGLLDGRDAASHWSAASLFRDRYPNVRFRPERILCDSGVDQRIITTGGASSWQDLSLYLVSRFCGVEEALRIARIFLIGDRNDGQLPFAAMATPRRHQDAVIQSCQEWIGQHYEVSNPVAAMIERSGLAERTFKRRFLRATGYTPIEYVQALRVEEAKQLLESGDGPIDAIAEEVGYDDPAFFRKLFRRLAGVSPAQYRRRMRAALPRIG